MLRKLPIILLAGALFLSACDTKEKMELQSKADSLQAELDAKIKVEQTLQEVGALMDSIDASRQLLKVGMVEGTSYNDYSSRMKNINSYVKDTQSKIDDLESELKKSSSKSSSLSKMVASLKKDLEERTKEIAFLKEQAEINRQEKDSLIQAVDIQNQYLLQYEAEILTKQQELSIIEARIQELMIQSKVSEADAYYARAVAVEEAANRTKLAPRKKKETLREAIELYKKSLSLGKSEAQAKIDELESKM